MLYGATFKNNTEKPIIHYCYSNHAVHTLLVHFMIMGFVWLAILSLVSLRPLEVEGPGSLNLLNYL